MTNEQPARISLTIGNLHAEAGKGFLFGKRIENGAALLWDLSCDPAVEHDVTYLDQTPEESCGVHAPDYIQRLRIDREPRVGGGVQYDGAGVSSKWAGNDASSVNSGPSVVVSCVGQGQDPETRVKPGSLPTALAAAGAVREAVEFVMDAPAAAAPGGGGSRNAFCVVRPPGHHACFEISKEGGSTGFCLINNAACALRYALERRLPANDDDAADRLG